MSTYYTSASGVAANGDGNSTITYTHNSSSITQKSNTTTSFVYIPIANPPNTTAKLQSLSVECDTSSGGEITEVMVYFGKGGQQPLLDDAQTRTTDFTITAGSAAQEADSEPYGITLTLKLNLPNSSSTVTIYSASLKFTGP